MSDENNVIEALRLQKERNKGQKPMPVREGFARSSDRMAKYTTYLEKDLIERLKMRAVEEKTTPAKLIAEVVGELLSKPARKPEPKRRPRIT
ncbi:ParB-like dsDNA partitioning protein [Mycobacterium phage Lokk]|nr:ParB-like dsDNA partitioning protein [Mycobacterium phage Lokk]